MKINLKIFGVPFILLLVILPLISSAPQVLNLIANNTQTTNSTFLFKFNFSSNNNVNYIDYLANLTFTIANGTTIRNTSFSFLNDLIVFYNFDNRSSLSENSTQVIDLTQNNNNGTIFFGYTNISWANNGKYNGAYNWIGSRGYIRNTGTNFFFYNNTDKSISLWFKPNEQASSQALLSFGNTAHGINFYLNSAGTGTIQYQDSAGATQTTGMNLVTSNYEYGVWNNFIITFSGGTNYTVYLNGQVVSGVNLTSIYNYTNSQLTLGAFSDGTFFYNGSMDDFMLFNKTLNITEVNTLYNLSLTRYDKTNWTFIYEQSVVTKQLNSSVPNETLVYGFCAMNYTGSLNCSSNFNLIRTLAIKNIYSDFLKSYRNISDYFYGINDEAQQLSSLSMIDSNADGTLDTLGNYSFYRTAFTDSKMNSVRVWILLDKLSLSEGVWNTTGTSYTRNINILNDELEYLRNNNYKILVRVQGMPGYLQNRTTGLCNSTAWESCTPYNIPKYMKMFDNLINNITKNRTTDYPMDFELWNEPYGASWLNNLSYDNVGKGLNLSYYYNITYNYLKANYSFIDVGAGGFFRKAPVMTETFVSNVTNQWDFISIHPYGYYRANHQEQYNDTKNLLTLCATYSANCSKIYLSEWSVGNDVLKNTTSLQNEFYMSFAVSYYSLLKDYADTVLNFGHEFAKTIKYPSLLYPEYPTFYHWISQEGLDNPTQSYYSPYNTTKDFASYCPDGARLINITEGGESLLYSLLCESEDRFNITLVLINADTKAIQVNFNISNDYKPAINYSIREANITFDTTGAGEVNDAGIKITPNRNGTLKAVYKDPIDTSTMAFISVNPDESHTINASFVGNVATFNYPLVAGTNYILATLASGGRDARYKSYTVPVSYIDGNITNGWRSDVGGFPVLYSISNFTVMYFEDAVTQTTYPNITSLTNKKTGQVYSNPSNIIMASYDVAYLGTDFSLILNSVDYDTTTQSGGTETFIINFTALTLTDLDFIYNNTAYPTTIVSYGSNNYVATSSITIPSLDTNENKTFYWKFNNGAINTSLFQQAVNFFKIDDCTLYSTLFLNYTLRDEDTQNLINDSQNTSTKVTVNIYALDYTTLISTYSLSSTKNNTQICLGSLNSSYYIDSIAEYDGGADYVTEYNNIQRYYINNTIIPVNINLYDLLTTRSQEFLVTFKDNNFLPQSDVLVDVTRYYVDEGIFKSVEVAKTDTQGQTLTHLVLGDVVYTFIFKKNGVILAVLNNFNAKCNNIATGDCQINVNAYSSNLNIPDFNYNNGLGVLQTFDEDTRTLTAVFTVQNSGTSTVSLNLTKFDRFGNTTICSDYVTSSSGTLTCIIPESYGNSTIISRVYNRGVLSSIVVFGMGNNPNAIYDGGTVTILAIMIIITLSMLFISDIRGIMLGTFIGLILSGTLIFINSGSLLSVGSSITYAIIAGLIILYKVNQREER